MSGDTVTHWIDGRPVPSTGQLIEVVNPATGAVVGTVPAGTAADVDAAVRAARAAFVGWSTTSLGDRAKIVERISEGLNARAEQIAQSVTAEMGSPIAFSRAVQAGLPVAVSATFAAIARDFTWEEEIGNSLVIREPIGVVGAITPWNFPLHQIVAKVAPAVVAGNTVVVKPSEVAPLTAAILAEVVAEAGLPSGVLNIVHGTGPQVGEAIARHPGVDMVSFTGSTAAGKRVAVVASDTVKRVALELGGKSASVVLDSADIEEAARAGLAGAWINSGQTCAAWTRMLVPAAHHDRMVEALVAAAAAHPVGRPTDDATVIGPMSSELQRQRVTRYIERGVADGARLVLGGASRVSGFEEGAYVQPTIFADVDPNSVIAQQEIFGPVLSLISYGSEEEAVEIANNTVYGLSGAVFGEPDHALEIARKLRTGQVAVNDGQFNVLAPFGGYKQSGNGREFGRYGLEEFLETKSVQR
ncbi:aldehyde dehydrogenase (NAD+) [Nocardia amikacinitolerans]|uniref:aldehyde dehydrogenase family protein n=1 Tax=Nocardia amikacinitolerans TaxID=756689 RepID=UPI00082EFA2F|nr:aldehyde dehydrogenase family protein [Nocardia amikacinitolerans]MCP2317687.1 aldehyde dehydrogenase (NAD+) [Nocardia amikacinitolerans]